ncbi:cysteine desulfurase [Candidatus Woesearchaeota archaeon]|nr:cysteine desulfurase [Candidatus Woesearchaeota archaeon]
MKEIYVDNSATTRIDDEVIKAMLPYYTEYYGNPGSLHEQGVKAAEAVDKARNTIADLLNAKPDEIIFTGSGTEANNLALLGYARKNRDKGDHIITTRIEHPSVLACCRRLEDEGFKVTYLNVDNSGLIDIEQLQATISKDTILVSIIYANNEIGTIQDIPAISNICKERKVPLHIDACQAAAYLSLDTEALGVSMMTLNASKIYGPKGIGALYKKKGITLEPIIVGGNQERGLRGGTENTPAIVGFATALELARKSSDIEADRLSALRDGLIQDLTQNPDIHLNGHPARRLPNNINIVCKSIEAESLILLLSEDGIYANTRSACSTQKKASSHVLRSIGLGDKDAQSSIRISLGKYNSAEEVKRIGEKIKEIVLMLKYV